MRSAFYLTILLLLFLGCIANEGRAASLQHCIDCHNMQTDINHPQNCTSCHQGNNQATDKEKAHRNLVASPAHPDHMVKSCGGCHADIVNRLPGSVHFTLRHSTNLFRKAFGAVSELNSFVATPQKDAPDTVLALADDLLRRNCFRCHLYSSGDRYPSVAHGTGCAACHMAFSEGHPESHRLQKPGDGQCLSCHYGNYVGFDYYGRFEHDLPAEYRTPFTTKNKYFRPYGVEYHQLQPDVHQLRGMLCIDCHSGRELMTTGGEKPSCKGCHSREQLLQALPAGVENRQGMYVLHGQNGKDHTIPLMQHPAHRKYAGKVACQGCHAQWTYNDTGKHFLRSDVDDFDIWANLSIQGNFEVESIIDNNNDFDKPELPGQTTDKITGEPKTGLWHKGFTMRRWEPVLLGRDAQGIISPMRPVLDYFLSWIDDEETVRFDSVPSKTADKGLRPYVPHTTGPAGLFYQERLEQFLAIERAGSTKSVFTQPDQPIHQ